MADQPRRVRYNVKSLSCNMLSVLPENKEEADAFLQNVCEALLRKSRVVRATAGVRGVRVLFVGSGLTPTEVARFQRSVDEIVEELLAVS